MLQRFEGIDYFQATNPNMLFSDVSLYTETISSPSQAPVVIHQAIAAAYAGRGVAHLTVPMDVLAAKADAGVASVATLRPRPEFCASEADVLKIARLIDNAGSIVIVCGAGCQGAAEELRALSDRLNAPLIHSVKGKDIMPYNDPRWMGGIGMIGTKANYHAVMHCDLFLMLGTDYPYSEFLPRECVVIQVDERARVIGRRAPTEFGVVGSVRQTVKSLLDRVRPKSDSGFFDRVTTRRKSWDEMQDEQADPARSKDRIHPQAVARMVSDLAKRDAVFVIDTGLNTLWSGNWIRQNGEQRIIGSFNNGAVGTALGQANGLINSVVMWAVLVFCCLGMTATLNALSMFVELLGAVSVASAIFLILEFSQPYSGYFRIPPDGTDQRIEELGQRMKIGGVQVGPTPKSVPR